MISQINKANWCGPNAAGMGGTPAPGVTQSKSGLHGCLYTGPGAQGNENSLPGPAVQGAESIYALYVTDSGTTYV